MTGKKFWALFVVEFRIWVDLLWWELGCGRNGFQTATDAACRHDHLNSMRHCVLFFLSLPIPDQNRGTRSSSFSSKFKAARDGFAASFKRATASKASQSEADSKEPTETTDQASTPSVTLEDIDGNADNE